MNNCGPHLNKLRIEQYIESTGILGEFSLEDNSTLKFVVENAGVGNTFVIRMKLSGQTSWVVVGNLVGNVSKTIQSNTYDLLQVECTVFSGSVVKIIASGFEE